MTRLAGSLACRRPGEHVFSGWFARRVRDAAHELRRTIGLGS
jgi:hypothetical protein